MKALFAALTMAFFRLPTLQTSLQPLNEKSPDLRSRLSLVAGSGEISNLDLLRDLNKIVKFLNVYRE